MDSRSLERSHYLSVCLPWLYLGEVVYSRGRVSPPGSRSRHRRANASAPPRWGRRRSWPRVRPWRAAGTPRSVPWRSGGGSGVEVDAGRRRHLLGERGLLAEDLSLLGHVPGLLQPGVLRPRRAVGAQGAAAGRHVEEVRGGVAHVAVDPLLGGQRAGAVGPDHVLGAALVVTQDHLVLLGQYPAGALGPEQQVRDRGGADPGSET